MAAQLMVTNNTDKNQTGCRTGETYLGKLQVAAYGGRRKGQRIEVISGAVWLTQSGDGEDYILSAGEQLTIARPGMVVVQPVQSASASFCWSR